MKKIRNFTAHPLCFYKEDQVQYVSAIRKHVLISTEDPILVVESEGMLSVDFENIRLENEESPVPVFEKKYINRVDRLPKIDSDDMVVVSAAYAMFRKLQDILHYPLYTVKDVVYDKSGKPVGCLGLIRNA